MMFRRTLKGLNLLIVIITVCMRTGMHELWAGLWRSEVIFLESVL